MADGLMEYLFIIFLSLTTGFLAAPLVSGASLSLNHSSVRATRQITRANGDHDVSTTMLITEPDVPDSCSTSYDAVTLIRNELFIFIGKYHWRIGASGLYPEYPALIREMWSSLPRDLTHVDTVYERPDLRIAIFIGKQLYLYEAQGLLPGYPKPLTSLGLPESLEKLDAAMVWGQNNKTYFYSGTMFWRFDEDVGRVELDYPRDMGMWKGIGYNIDSAFTWKDKKTYFFKGKGFWKFENHQMRVENSNPLPARFWMRCGLSTHGTESPSPATVSAVARDGASNASIITRPQKSNSCIFPPYPLHATYSSNIVNAKPGDAYDIIAVNITCKEGFVANGPIFVICYSGQWTSQIPQCNPQCRLPPVHPSVGYSCLVALDMKDGLRTCNEYEPSGTQVIPFCQTNYYSTTVLKGMHCINGEWNNVQKCSPDCGKLIPNGTLLVLGGETADLGEVPWHAGIYIKTTNPYKQICGGSLISTNTVISAAHCFWNNLVGKLPSSDFAVAVGKLYRRWDSKLDHPQWSDVASLWLPVRFRGSATNYQDDIAVVVLSTAVEYNTYIRPVCIDFDVNFERRQLQPGNKGKVAGWGLTAENGNASQTLQVVDLPYITVNTCFEKSPASFIPYITSDKICAGFDNGGTALCRGDSGGGLAFPELDKGTLRYYLRGVTSTAPSNEHLCNANTYTSFTRLISHEHFITRFWED